MAQEYLTDVIDKRFGDSLAHLLKLVDPERKYPTDINLTPHAHRTTEDVPLSPLPQMARRRILRDTV